MTKTKQLHINVYYAHSISGQPEKELLKYKTFSKKLKGQLGKNCTLVSPLDWKLSETDNNVSLIAINVQNTLRKTNVFIADCTHPSVGLGYEVGWWICHLDWHRQKDNMGKWTIPLIVMVRGGEIPISTLLKYHASEILISPSPEEVASAVHVTESRFSR